MGDTSLIFNIIARDKTSATFDKLKAGAAAAGVAIGATLMAGAQMAMDKSRLDNKVAAQLGATPAEAKRIGELSSAVYAAGFGADLPEVSAAIKDAAQNGLVDVKTASKETAQAVTQNLLTVSSVLEEDTARTSAAISQMLKTGLARTSEEAMDLLVTATQKGVNKSQDLLDTTNEYGTQFRKLGLDGKHAFGLLSQAIQAGARDSDTAADAIKEFSLRAVDGSKLSATGFKNLGLDAKQMTSNFAKGGDLAAESFNTVLQKLKGIQDPVKRNATAVALFGTKAEDLGDALFAMDLDTAKQEMDGFKGATGRAATTAAAGAASWSALGRQFQMALVDVMNQALPAVNAVFGFLQKNSSWVKPLAIGLGLVAVAIGVITAAQWAWNIAVAATGIPLLIAGIVALVAALVYVAVKTNFFQNLWKHVWGFLKGVGAWFAGPFAGFFVTLWNKITASLSRAKNQLMNGINTIKGFFLSWHNRSVQLMAKIVSKALSLANWFRNLPGRIGGSLKNVFNGLWTGFKAIVNRIVGAWNNLSFTVGGGSFAGVSLPSVTVSTPNLPYLDTGGRIEQTGLAVVHRGEQISKPAVARRTGPGTGSGGGGRGGTLVIKGDGRGGRVVTLLLELLREGIRDQGGDVVKVLTPR